ncbi:MAG: SUMF1/EgtB/PvdO family nonheme iron enzyme [Planctomycetes bacterium]|nr:SUMF1/EgtB/PvdO family nonheme iron enzyme [Planctomycetota bacterium]
MAEPRPYTVFLSSTYRDQRDRREKLFKVILDAGLHPLGMEQFKGIDQLPLDESLEHARKCDLYLGVVAWRYGFVSKEHGKSFTELEYLEAFKIEGKTRLVFVVDDDVPRSRMEEDTDTDNLDRHALQRLLDGFKARLRADAMGVRPFEKDEDLLSKVGIALSKWAEKQRARDAQAGRAVVAASPHHSSSPQLAPSESLLPNYLAAARDQFSRIELIGFPARGSDGKVRRAHLKLSDLYVSLRARWTHRASFDKREALDKAREAERSDENLTLLTALHESIRQGHRGLVIVGDPGAGKTTHLRRLALWCASGETAVLHLPDGTIPLFLPLRFLESPDLAAPERDARSLLPFLAREVGKLVPGATAAEVERLLTTNPTLLLFDGLDEVPSAARARIARAIEKLIQQFTKARSVVSCRIFGYADPSVRLDGAFLDVEVAPLREEQSHQFVRDWFRQVELLSGDADAPARADQLASGLVERLKQPDIRATRVAGLAANPLTLTLLCLIYRDRQGRLPKERVTLYDALLELLVETWRSPKGAQFTITKDQACGLLQPIALFLHGEKGRTHASLEELEKLLRPALDSHPVRDLRKLSPRGFLETIRDESGVLTGFGADRFGFIHLGLQEFLAAIELRRIITQELISKSTDATLQKLAVDAHDSWWQEVLLLFLGLDDARSPALFSRTIRVLLNLPKFDAQLLRLCLEDASMPSEEPYVAVVHEAATSNEVDLFSDPERDRCAIAFEALSRLGKLDALRNHPALAAAFARRPEATKSAQPTPAEPREPKPNPPTLQIFTKGDLHIEAIWIPAGEFLMGSPDGEPGRDSDEGPVHRVHITKPFYLGKFTVTNEQYHHFLAANPSVRQPDYWTRREFNQPNQPVVGISWEEAVEFCRWFGHGAQLPTEAQWEYACRSGMTTPYSFESGPEQLGEYAWFWRNSGGAPHPVGTKKPNPFGLHDMHGNVSEWCADWKGRYTSEPQRDPGGPATGAGRVCRGGSFANGAVGCRSAFRSRGRTSFRRNDLGFRVCFPLPATR